MAAKKTAISSIEVQGTELARVLLNATYRITNVAIDEGGYSVVDALIIPNRGGANVGTFVQLPCDTRGLLALMSSAGPGRSKTARNSKPTVEQATVKGALSSPSDKQAAGPAAPKKREKRRQRNPITGELGDAALAAKVKAEVKRHGPSWLAVQQERFKEGLSVFPSQE